MEAIKAIASSPHGHMHCVGVIETPVELKKILSRCPLPRRKCLGALALSKKTTGLQFTC